MGYGGRNGLCDDRSFPERGIAPWQPPWVWPEPLLRSRPNRPRPRSGLLAFVLCSLEWVGRALRYRPLPVPELTYWRVVGWPGCS